MDGMAALAETLARAGYESTVQAVAAHPLFLDPSTVSQTCGEPVFPVIRNPNRRGEVTEVDGRTVMFDDNTTPTLTLLWGARRKKGPDVQYNHVFGDPRNPATYTALWNLCVTPAFLAKTTDGSNHPEVLAALRYRVVDLYGCWPAGEERPAEPAGYQDLAWAEAPEPVADLEAELRARLEALEVLARTIETEQQTVRQELDEALDFLRVQHFAVRKALDRLPGDDPGPGGG